MKKIYSLITIAVLFGGCTDDFLDTKSPSIQSVENVFENVGMTRSAIMGIYSQLATTFVYGQKMSVNWQGVSDIELASGYASVTNTDKTSDTGAANYWCDWYNATIRWSDIFKLTELASAAIDGIRKSELINEQPETMKTYLGEALVLRSLAYFELVRRWGDIPYKDGMSKSDLSNVYLNKTDRDSVYAALVRDLEEAVNYLPWIGESADYNSERITKGFAKGLLARVALFAGGWSVRDGKQFSDANVEHYPNTEHNPGMAEMNGYYTGRPKNWRDYYEIAERQCAEMIGDAENPHRLDPDYGNIWKTVCALKYNAYNENLFEVANGVGYSGDIGTLMGRGMDGGLGYGSRGFGGNYVNTNAYYFYSFDRDDLRRDYAVYWPTYTKSDNVLKETMGNDIMSVRLGKWCFFWTDASYRAIALTATSRVPTGINWILMRYPDIYLMFAEARYALSGADAVSAVAGISARQALEKVRERAFGAGSPKISQYAPDFFDAIVNERAWEFGATIIVQLSEAKTVGTILTNCVAEGKSVVALIFESAQVYEIEQFTIPAGISTLYIVGDATAEDVQPELYLHRVTMSAPFDVLRFQNVDLNARLNSSNYFFDIGTVNCFKTVDFDGCTIRNIGRCLVRPNHADLDIETIRINNCIIKSVGVSGYGLIVYGREIANVSLISLTNSTIMEIGSDRLMQLKGATKQIVIDRCILCNFTSGSAEVLRIDTKPGSITWTNSIFCGTNNGAKLNAGRGDYSAYLEYYNCYVTSDLTMNTYKFTNATTLEMTSEQMFVDPRGGDFHLREGVRFDGEGTAGDPRWW